MSTPTRAPAVLTLADHYGTLAAARALGRAGVRVTIADGRSLAPAGWSRHVARTLPFPEIGVEPERFLERLLEFGVIEPGHALFASSDDDAWLFARHRDALARSFLLDVPDFSAVDTLLNKWRLHRACAAVGLRTPDTWLPRDEDDLARLRDEARFPLVIKPQTQVFLRPHQKGRIARRRDELLALHRDFVRATRHGRALLDVEPHASLPVVQSFAENAVEGIYNLSGFVDRSGELYVVEASRKVLQWPRRLGIGLCFEEADVVPALAGGVRRLCARVGYHGVFEVEFLETDGDYALIDFNPRFYGQMAFDVGRGLDLPLLSYLAATGAREELLAEIERWRARPSELDGRVHCNRIELEIVLRLLRLAHRIDEGDAARWRAFAHRPSARRTDAVLDVDDPLPAVVDAASAVLRRIAHPRSAWRASLEG